MVWLADARTPPAMRLYAIGDVHGCLDELQAVHDRIDAELSRDPPGDWRVIHVGDYIDRGQDSAGVLDHLIARQADDPRYLCVLGNHDLFLLQALAGNVPRFALWAQHGGRETLANYGTTPERLLSVPDMGAHLAERVPQAHQRFLAGLPRQLRFGDYLFVHAGIDPDRPLDDQDPEDLVWIRQPFIRAVHEFDAVVIHGHTPVRRVQVRPNRIDIDTGAVFGHALSCLVLDGDEQALLTDIGRIPLVAPAA